MKILVFLFMGYVFVFLAGCDSKSVENSDQNDPYGESRSKKISVNVVITNHDIYMDMSMALKESRRISGNEVYISEIGATEYINGNYSNRGWAVSSEDIAYCKVPFPEKILYGQQMPSCLSVPYNTRFNPKAEYIFDVVGFNKDGYIEFDPVIVDKRTDAKIYVNSSSSYKAYWTERNVARSVIDIYKNQGDIEVGLQDWIEKIKAAKKVKDIYFSSVKMLEYDENDENVLDKGWELKTSPDSCQIELQNVIVYGSKLACTKIVRKNLFNPKKHYWMDIKGYYYLKEKKHLVEVVIKYDKLN